MFPTTPADMNPELAQAIGRFSQACNYLEHDLILLLSRLLPLTDEMGRVLFAGNQLKRNTDILRALLMLPEVAIDDELRERLKPIPTRIETLNGHRSRLMHNRMIGGFAFVDGEPPAELTLLHDKQDGKSSAAHPISVEMIKGMTMEAKALSVALYIPPVTYDLSTWKPAGRRYLLKDYPTAEQPKRERPPRQKRNGRTKSEARKTTPSQGE